MRISDKSSHEPPGSARTTKCFVIALVLGNLVSLMTSIESRAMVPMRDAADLPFRRAPMAESSRSIVIPLAADLHLAFDVHLLRTHTVWRGPSLNLFGPPFTGTKSPFVCTFDGISQWTMPPLNPWLGSGPRSLDSAVYVRSADFRGVSSKGGKVSLFYDLMLESGETVRVAESPSSVLIKDSLAVVRRLEIGPSRNGLWYLVHAEMGRAGVADKDGVAPVILRNDDAVVAAVRGMAGLKWKAQEGDVAYDVELIAEKKGESIVEQRRVEGHETRLYLWIPAHDIAVSVDIASALAKSPETVAEQMAKWQMGAALPADLIRAFDRSTATDNRNARSIGGDRSGPNRVHGDEFFKIEHFPLPEEIQLLVTGMDWLPDGNLAVCTWSGEIYIVENPAGPVVEATYRRFARGLNEAFGLRVINGQVYVIQKAELTRVTDTDRDGEADLFETINDNWGYTGNYHAFAFGPVLDKSKNLFVFLTGQRGRWDVPYVGWALRMNLDGSNAEGFSSGLRAPNGFGTYGPEDDLFVADNQGNWIGACKLNHLQAGRFYGFPSGTPAPESEYKSPAQFSPPAVWFPRKLSPSTSGFVTIDDERFGPFMGQMLVGDFQNAVVMRVFLEKVDGEWQGAVWPFARGFYSGVNRLEMGSDGKLYAGGLKNRAWAASAPKDASLDRVSFTGKTPFEVKEVRAAADGFELIFTEPADRETAGNVENYFVSQYTYEYHQAYGSPEMDHEGNPNSATEIEVLQASVSDDGLRVRLVLNGSKAGFVSAVQLLDIESANGEPIWHDTFYYTLNQIPK